MPICHFFGSISASRSSSVRTESTLPSRTSGGSDDRRRPMIGGTRTTNDVIGTTITATSAHSHQHPQLPAPTATSAHSHQAIDSVPPADRFDRGDESFDYDASPTVSHASQMVSRTSHRVGRVIEAEIEGPKRGHRRATTESESQQPGVADDDTRRNDPRRRHAESHGPRTTLSRPLFLVDHVARRRSSPNWIWSNPR